jgi:hypothetical protein
MTVTPGAFACSSSVTFVFTTFCVMSSASMVVMALPSVRLETAPGTPVTTIWSSVLAVGSSVKSAVMVWSADSVIARERRAYPMRLTPSV